MTDYGTGTDGVGLNAAGSSGALVATDWFDVHGQGLSAHVQYMKVGFGNTDNSFFTVGDTVSSVAKPLPISLRSATDGAALTHTSNVLNVHTKTQGITLHVSLGDSIGDAIFVQGTAGASPIHVMGSSASEPLIVQGTGGTFSPTNPQYTLPTMLFGLSGGNSAAPVGVTGTRLLVNHPENVTVISDGSGTYVQATGGFTLSTAAAAKVLSTTPSILFGATAGGGIASVGVTGDRLLVDLDGETVTISQTLTGSADIGGTKTMPSLLYGISLGGPSAAVVGVTGSQRLLTSLDGSVVGITTASGNGIPVHPAKGTTLPSNGLNTMPVMVYGLCGNTAAPVGVTNGKLEVFLGASLVTVDVTVSASQKVLNATADAGQMNRYVHVAGPTSNAFKHQELHPVFVSGKADGSTYSYPVGITTSMVGASGGAWQLHVTGDMAITRFTPTVTVSATQLNTRGLTAKAAGQDSIIAHGETSGTGWNWIKVTGGFCGATSQPSSLAPTILFGNTAGGGFAPTVVTGDMLKVGIGHDVKISASSADPIYTYASGGTSGTHVQANLLSNIILYGISSGNSAAPFGMTGAVSSGKGSLFVSDIDGRSAGRDTISIFGGVDVSHGAGNAGGTYNIPWVPSLVMGVSGASAAGVGMSGDALNVNMVNAGITVDVTVGTHVEVKNDDGPALFIQGATKGHGACAGVAAPVIPVYVAGGTYGDAIKTEGTAGMRPIEVMGYSGANFVPVGITGNADYSLATDENLNLLGNSLDNLYNIIANGLGDDSTVGTPNNKFATEAQMNAMAPDGSGLATKIANESNQAAMKGYLQNISNAVGSTIGTQDLSTMQVDVVSIPQPGSFVHGQQTVTSTAAVLHNAVHGLSSGVKVKGHQNNSDYIYVGLSNVNASNGYPLGPSEELFLEVDNIQKVYVYASPNGTACYIGS